VLVDIVILTGGQRTRSKAGIYEWVSNVTSLRDLLSCDAIVSLLKTGSNPAFMLRRKHDGYTDRGDLFDRS
jgi:hypothetical protein